MSKPRLFGQSYSVYVRVARLALLEKGVDHTVVPVDVFAPGGAPAEHLLRHPFGRIPALDHDGFQLYETGAITRYVDEAFTGVPLQPPDPRGRARMNQIVSILDSYAYRTLVWDIYVERSRAVAQKRSSDEAKIAAALPRARLCLDAIGALAAGQPFLCGPALSLADLHAAPMLVYFAMVPEGRALIDERPGLARWLTSMQARPSLMATRFDNEPG